MVARWLASAGARCGAFVLMWIAFVLMWGHRADQRCDQHAAGTCRVDRRMARGRSVTAGRRADKSFSLTPVSDPRMGPTLGFGDPPARGAVTSPQTFFFWDGS